MWLGPRQMQIKKRALPSSQTKIKKSGGLNLTKLSHKKLRMKKPREMPKKARSI
jgi:hypothetical protein